MMTTNARSETKGELKVRSVLRIVTEKETLSIPSQEIYKMNGYDCIIYAFPLGVVYFLISRRYQCKFHNKKSAFIFTVLRNPQYLQGNTRI